MTKDLLQEPPGLEWGSFTNHENAKIRTAHLSPAGEPRGRVVLLTGFRESIEKYFDVMKDLSARGLEVHIMDWRGQGGSDRFLPATPEKSHHTGYDGQIETLHSFMQSLGASALPTVMMAHSMGGHIGLRYLKEHPGAFDSAVLTAPMLDIQTGALPQPLARQMAKFAKACGYLDKFVPGGGAWDDAKEKFENNAKTHDRARFEAAQDILRLREDLRMGDATYGWVYHTFQSIDVLNREEYLKAIDTPVLMQISSDERVVSREAQQRAARLLPHCRKVETENCRHEIWQETEIVRANWLKQVDAFLAERLNAPKVAPKKPKAQALARRPRR